MNRTSPPAEEPHLATPAPVQPTPAPPTVAKPAEPASARPERRLAGIAVSPLSSITPCCRSISALARSAVTSSAFPMIRITRLIMMPG